MRISDWSSDVCSSDLVELRSRMIDIIDDALHNLHALIAVGLCTLLQDAAKLRQISDALRLTDGHVQDDTLINRDLLSVIVLRSEEHREGIEWVLQCKCQ